eukprot:scaffold8519_cov277-Pinguiococcus_pyrenoidosus.AAC.2
MELGEEDGAMDQNDASREGPKVGGLNAQGCLTAQMTPCCGLLEGVSVASSRRSIENASCGACPYSSTATMRGEAFAMERTRTT